MHKRRSRNVSYHHCYYYFCSYVFTYSIFIDSDCKLLEICGFISIIAIISTLLIINSTDGWSEWFVDQLKVMKIVTLVGSGGGGWDLSPGVLVHTSLVQESLCCSLLTVVLVDSIVLWRPRLKFRELKESPLRIGSKDQSYILSVENYSQGFEPTGHTQFQEICDKLFLYCLVTHGFNEAGFPLAWKNLMRVSPFSPRWKLYEMNSENHLERKYSWASPMFKLCADHQRMPTLGLVSFWAQPKAL